MIQWKKFNEDLFKVKNVIEYNSIIENKTINLLKEIFPNSKIKLEKDLVQKYFYDFSIEMSDLKLFCEIKREKISLIKFWKNNISLITKEISKLNTNNNNNNKKYLLILLDSDDSTAKMNLEPILDDILVINSKMLFYLQECVPYSAEDILILIKNVFKEASGVLYDNFINNLISLIKDLESIEYEINLDHFPINHDILKLEFKSVFNKSIKLFPKNQIDLLHKFLQNYYSYDSLEYPGMYRKNVKSTELIQDILIKSENVITFQKLEKIGFSLEEITELKNTLHFLDLNFKFVETKKCQILFLVSTHSSKKMNYYEYIINPLIKEGFKIQIIEYESNVDEIIKKFSKANIIIIDLIEKKPKAFYYLGRAHNFPINRILLVTEDQKFSDYLENEIFLVYKEGDFVSEKIRKNLLKILIKFCAEI